MDKSLRLIQRSGTGYCIWTPLGGASADFHGHGTHVCGSAVGDGLMNANIRVTGTAPQARLVVQCLRRDPQGWLLGLPGDLAQLFEPPYSQYEARVHSNSWGTVSG